MINLSPALDELDKEIQKLQAAKEILLSLNGNGYSPRRGRPPKRRMSAEARARIAAAQRARWAKQKRG